MSTVKNAQQQVQRLTSNALYHEYQGYYNQLLVGQIEPDLDIAWSTRLAKIFAEMPEKWCVRIDAEILRPKGIIWDRASGNFRYRPQPIGLKEFAERECHPKLRPFAEWCVDAMKQIAGTNSAPVIVDLLENAIEKINALEVGTDVDMLISRRTLKEKFIHTAAAIVKMKTHLKMLANQRGIDANAARAFINEIFLKQQLLDYRFHITRRRQLKRMPHPLLGTYLSYEQGVRQLEVVRTTQYIFALATSHESDINVFSARRFMNEETISAKRGGDVSNFTYFNGVCIREDALDDAASAGAFKGQIDSIISIANQVSPVVIELLENMEENYDRNVRAELFRPLESYNIGLAQAIAQKLRKYELGLQQYVQQPLRLGLCQKATHEEDFKYLFAGIRQLMSEALTDFDSFQRQPAVVNDPEVERMVMRLQAYVKLLVKRSSQIFNKAAVEDWGTNSATAARPVTGLRDIVQRFSREYAIAKGRIEDIQQLLDGKDSFWDRLLHRRQRRELALAAAQGAAKKIQRASFLELTTLFNKFKGEVLYLEHKSVLFIKRQRNFAVCAGSNGVDELPALVTLPENYNDFDPSAYAGLLARRTPTETQEDIDEARQHEVRRSKHAARRR